MPENNRIESIDVMRGLILILMLFITDLYLPVVSQGLVNRPHEFNGYGIADWIFPGFLFIVGMVIPISIGKRISEGQNIKSTARHIIIRTISLLTIGVLMLNAERVNAEFTGIGKNLWAILIYTGIFLIWNKYQETDRNFFTIAGLKLAGIAVLVILVYKFRSGEFENNGSLITGWWGIPGIIGWGYLVSALIYLAIRDNILNTIVASLFFLTLNIFYKLDYFSALHHITSIFGVVIEGKVPLIILSGVITTLILKKYSFSNSRKAILIIVTIGISCILFGIIIRKWFNIIAIQAIPSWELICIGISMVLYALLHWTIDIKKAPVRIHLIKVVGAYSLTTYLASNILYYLIWSTHIPLFFYKQSGVYLIVIAGSIFWTLLMIAVTFLLVRYNIKLRL